MAPVQIIFDLQHDIFLDKVLNGMELFKFVLFVLFSIPVLYILEYLPNMRRVEEKIISLTRKYDKISIELKGLEDIQYTCRGSQKKYLRHVGFQRNKIEVELDAVRRKISFYQNRLY